jgi:membrane protein DedA with SNARE-associated domain
MTVVGPLLEYSNALILPLAIIEGPVVTILAGFLCAQGHLDWLTAVGLLLCGDLIGDLLCYAIGRASVGRLADIPKRRGTGYTIGAELRHRLTNSSAKMLLIGKWTHSIGFAVLIGSGMLRVPLLKFVVVNFLATLPKVLLLFALGYLGAEADVLLWPRAAVAVPVLAAVGIACIILIVRRDGGLPFGTPRR